MIIAIDGPSGTGKSTIAKKLADDLHFLYFDTGAMYRSFAWFIIQKKIDLSDVEAVKAALPEFDFQIRTKGGTKSYLVSGQDVTQEIRLSKVTSASSQLSTLKEVRVKMVELQRKIAKNKDAVFEGRDMGTVVFPNAHLKIFLTAKPEVRAERRYLEYVVKFPEQSHNLKKDQIQKEMEERDERDSSREISPLKKADDAFLIDTSSLTIEEVLREIKKHYFQKCVPKKKMRFSYYLVILSSRIILWLFFRWKVYGQKNFVPGPAIIAPNHTSFLDPPVVAVSCPEEIHFLARDSLFKIPLLGKLIRHLNSHPVSRHASDAKILKQICTLLEKEKIILFPEGVRSKDGNLAPFQPGLGFLAWKTGCMVIPVYVDGTFKALNRHQKWPRLFVKITCVVGTPIRAQEFAGYEKREAMQLISDRTFQAISDLKKWFEAGAHGNPP